MKLRLRPLPSLAIPIVFLSATVLSCSRLPTGLARGEDPLRSEEAAAGREPGAALLREGERIYREHCAGCHGVKGDGAGPAARFLQPKPRDFTQGVFKFASVPSGEMPRDEDLLRTLVRGLPGSSMPSWQFLSEQERRAVVAYVKSFSLSFAERPAGTPVAVSEDPFARDREVGIGEAVGRGRFVYHVLATCWQCHPSYASQEEADAMAAAETTDPVELRPNAHLPEMVVDAWGEPLLPTDFPNRRLKSGSAVADIYRTIAAGIGGTAMPTWKDGLEEKDLWALSYYVKSLADRRWTRASAIPSVPPEALLQSPHQEESP
jgi:mono/diheme cytochrome c family protein